MLEVHIRAIENLLRVDLGPKDLKTVEHWNNQVAQADKNNPFYPAVFIDFGNIQWQRMLGDTYQTGKATITLRCVSYNYRDTRDKAPDDDGKRLKRFEWIERIMNTLNGTAATDKVGNIIFNRLNLVSTVFDTNHAALFDDQLTFTCMLNYYGWWYGKDMKEILITGVETSPDDTLNV